MIEPKRTPNFSHFPKIQPKFEQVSNTKSCPSSYPYFGVLLEHRVHFAMVGRSRRNSRSNHLGTWLLRGCAFRRNEHVSFKFIPLLGWVSVSWKMLVLNFKSLENVEIEFPNDWKIWIIMDVYFNFTNLTSELQRCRAPKVAPQPFGAWSLYHQTQFCLLGHDHVRTTGAVAGVASRTQGELVELGAIKCVWVCTHLCTWMHAHLCVCIPLFMKYACLAKCVVM